jgi:hypothetical protein
MKHRQGKCGLVDSVRTSSSLFAEHTPADEALGTLRSRLPGMEADSLFSTVD